MPSSSPSSSRTSSISASSAGSPTAAAPPASSVPKTLEDFDWSFNPKIPKKQIYELATCQFIREAKCALFIGHPGLGKSHLAQAIGYEAIKQGFTVLRKSIFDLVSELMAEEA